MMDAMEQIKELVEQMKTKDKAILELKQQLWTEREKVRQFRKLLITLGRGRDEHPYSMPPTAFIEWAVAEHFKVQSEGEHGDEYQTPLWAFTLLCRRYFDLHFDCDANAAFDEINAVIQRMPDGWGTLDMTGRDDAYLTLIVCWREVGCEA